jgi:heat shock protein HslJ
MHDSSSLPLGPTPLCARYQPQLALLYTGALSPPEAAVVHEHISSCTWCQRELATYDALDAAARQHLAGAAFAPLTVEDIIHAAETPPNPKADVASTLETSRKGRPPLRHRARLSTLGPLAAVVALVLLAGVIFAQHSSGPGLSLGGKSTPPAVTQTANLTQTTWTLTRLIVDGREQPLVPDRAPTLILGQFNGQVNGIHGMGGCNGYGGTYTRAGDTLRLSGLYYTQMACNPAALMAQENAYFEALPRVGRYQLDGNTLTLSSADGSVRLTFRAN